MKYIFVFFLPLISFAFAGSSLRLESFTRKDKQGNVNLLTIRCSLDPTVSVHELTLTKVKSKMVIKPVTINEFNDKISFTQSFGRKGSNTNILEIKGNLLNKKGAFVEYIWKNPQVDTEGEYVCKGRLLNEWGYRSSNMIHQSLQVSLKNEHGGKGENLELERNFIPFSNSMHGDDDEYPKDSELNKVKDISKEKISEKTNKKDDKIDVKNETKKPVEKITHSKKEKLIKSYNKNDIPLKNEDKDLTETPEKLYELKENDWKENNKRESKRISEWEKINKIKKNHPKEVQLKINNKDKQFAKKENVQNETKRIESLENSLRELSTEMRNHFSQSRNINGRLHSLEMKHNVLQKTLFRTSNKFINRKYMLSNFQTPSAKEAEEICESFGGYLAEIDNELEFDFVDEFIYSFGPFPFITSFLLGGTDEREEGTWIHRHSQRPVEFKPRWFVDNFEMNKMTENCLSLTRFNSETTYFNDVICAPNDGETSLRFVCEIPL